MALINMDDEIMMTPVWFNLFAKVGDHEKAMGSLYFAKRQAKKYYSQDGSPIPKDVWIYEKLNDALIGTFFIEDEDGFMYIHAEQDFGSNKDVKKKKSYRTGAVSEFNSPDLVTYLEPVKQELQMAWISNFGDVAWIKSEIRHAIRWEMANPTRRKTPSGRGRFLNGWLSRSKKPEQHFTSLEPNWSDFEFEIKP